MKFHWGWGITLAMTMFISYIMYFIISSFRMPVNMVADDYYTQDLHYDQKKEKMQNVAALSTPPAVSYNVPEKVVRISLGQRAQSGTLRFMRPSDSRMDFVVPISTDVSGEMEVPAGRMVGGRWKVQLDWQTDGKGYWVEYALMVP